MVENYSYPMLWPEASYYSGGSGTADDPYQIADISAWQKLTWSPLDWDKHFILTADIDFKGMELIPIAMQSGQSTSIEGLFSGVFDGQGFSLINFVMNLPEKSFVGLFGYVGPTGRIQNLGVEAASVIGTAYVGGLTGYNYGTITNCHTAGTVASPMQLLQDKRMIHFGGLAGFNDGTISDCYAACSVSGYTYVGGLVGTNSNTINNSYATGTVNGSNYVGGLCGQNYYNFREPFSSEIRNSFASVDVSGTSYVGGFAGSNNQGRIIHCYSTGKPTGIDYVGGFCGSKSTGTSYEDTGNFWYVQTSQKQTSAMGTGKTTVLMKTLSTFTGADWDFASVWWLPEGDYPRLIILFQDYSGGVGSQTNPYKISTVDDWFKLINTPMHWGRHFLLTNDIDFEGRSLSPIAPDTNPYEDGFQGLPFFGTVDGQGFLLKNIIITLLDQDFVGLFGQVDEIGQIVNLGADNISVIGRSRVGGLAGRNAGGTISKCYTSGNVKASLNGGNRVGGLVGVIGLNGTINECYSKTQVSGDSTIGGLAGLLSAGIIRRSYASGNVSASGDYVGGLTGQIYNSSISCEIRNCYATGSVSGNTNVGGLVGNNYRGVIFRCYAVGATSGTADFGGLCGTASIGIGYEDTANFWDIETSETIFSAMGTGKTTSEMKSLITFTDAGWNFEETWWIIKHFTYPTLWPETAAYSGGDGTQQILSNRQPAAWRKLMSTPDDWGKFFRLISDIDFAAET
jgi:hypothetical protein